MIKEAEDADVSDDDVNYPARVYAATELLEKHCQGIRELLCQVGILPDAPSNQIVCFELQKSQTDCWHMHF